MDSIQNDRAAMVATTDMTFLLPKGSTTDVIQKEEWKHVSFPGGFKTSYAFIGDAILLLQGEGYSDLSDEKDSVAFGKAILDTYLKPNQEYVMIQDWIWYQNSSAKGRQYFIDSVVKDSRLKAIVFCNTTWSQAITIKIANRLKILDLDIHICSSPNDAITKAKGLISTHKDEKTESSSLLSTISDSGSVHEQQNKAHIQDLLDYLETIDWKSGKLIKAHTVSPEHPMLPVFDAITFIKSQLDKTFEERNLIEQQLIHHRDNLEVLVRQRTAELERSKQKLAELVVRDELTGFYNRRHFMETLTAEFERSKHSHSNLSMIIMDVDHFKSINDTYGHPGGDAVLVQLTRITRQALKGLENLFRIGGEEFAVIFPNTAIEEALATAEQLRRTIREAEFVLEGKAISVTISVGVGMVTDDEKTKEDFLKAVDNALYHAKGSGRDRIEFHGSMIPAASALCSALYPSA